MLNEIDWDTTVWDASTAREWDDIARWDVCSVFFALKRDVNFLWVLSEGSANLRCIQRQLSFKSKLRNRFSRTLEIAPHV